MTLLYITAVIQGPFDIVEVLKRLLSIFVMGEIVGGLE